MLFNGGKLAGNEQMTEDLCYEKKYAKFIGVYPRSQVNVYRTNGPLVIFFFLKLENFRKKYIIHNCDGMYIIMVCFNNRNFIKIC